MIEALVVAAVAFCFAIGVRNSVRAWQSIRWIEQQLETPPTPIESDLEFVILIPLLREQPVLERLLDRMTALDCRGLRRVTFVLITTARESSSSGETTNELLERALRARANPSMMHVHCDSATDTCKADQLNFALQRLGLHHQRSDRVFIGVYDADSSPDPGTLLYIAHRVAREPGLNAIQQVPLYFQNVRTARTLRELYLMTRPVHNAYFALTVEVPGERRQARALSRPIGSLRRVLGTWLSHGLGHGQFFRLDVLTDLGGFRPPSCDTQFGHALAYAGIPLEAHPMLDVGQTPESIGVLMKQGVVWFNSMNTFPRTWRLVEHLAPPNYCRRTATSMTARLIHSNIAWALYPCILALGVVWAAATGRAGILIAAGVAWAIYLIPVVLIVSRFQRWKQLCQQFEPLEAPSFWTRLGIIFMFGVEKLGSCVSPFMWLFFVLRQRMIGLPFGLQKTERA
jgi:hypothetical protein